MNCLLLILMLSNVLNLEKQDNIPIDDSFAQESYDLHYLVRTPKATHIPAPALILLHGFGSNEKDLFSLTSQIPDNWLVVSVRAPIPIGTNKFKWYDVKMVNDNIKSNMEDELLSRNAIFKLIDQLKHKYNIDKNKVVTAGFSQGAVMSLNLFLTEPNLILAAGCFSGRLMEKMKPLIKDKTTLKSKKVFIAHGTKDQMLPIHRAQENKEILESWGIKTTLSTDEAGHTITGNQLSQFVDWLNKL